VVVSGSELGRAYGGRPAAGANVGPVLWYLKMAGAALERWSWEERGAPTVELLQSVRKPRSSEHNRHIPVTAYCMTNGDHVLLESGLEHDLLRRLDREPAVVRIISQPFKLSWLLRSLLLHNDCSTAIRSGSRPSRPPPPHAVPPKTLPGSAS
jgi:hypothetical protein